jgi:rare lipoprotein A
MFFILFFSAVLLISGKEEQVKDSLESNGKASYYHDDFNGLQTSNGDRYKSTDFTAAHRTFPFNTFLLVTNKKNNKSVVVRVNDRGPFIKSRIIDLSHSAALKVGMVPFGVVPVRIEVLNFFDQYSVADSMFQQNTVIDCYAKKITIEKETIFIWHSAFWKHAFYMASSLALEYKTDQVCVRISGPPHHRIYQVLITGIETKKLAAKWVERLRKDGFVEAGTSS